MNIKNNVEDVRKNIMAPLDHMFDDHHLCDSKCCYKKRIEEDDKLSLDAKSDMIKVWYYRIKKDDNEMYKKLCKRYKFYSTEEKITHLQA